MNTEKIHCQRKTIYIHHYIYHELVNTKRIIFLKYIYHLHVAYAHGFFLWNILRAYVSCVCVKIIHTVLHTICDRDNIKSIKILKCTFVRGQSAVVCVLITDSSLKTSDSVGHFRFGKRYNTAGFYKNDLTVTKTWSNARYQNIRFVHFLFYTLE